MREFYAAAQKPYATPQEAAAELIVDTTPEAVVEAAKTAYHKIVTQEKYQPEQDPVVDFGEQVVTTNVFSKNERDPEIPYIITQEEFMQNDQDWQQVTLTYYVGDNVLTDHREDVIEDMEKTIGSDAILSFGINSSDPHTVHVCNEKIGILFEIVQHESSYTKEVLGVDASSPDLPSGRSRKDS